MDSPLTGWGTLLREQAGVNTWHVRCVGKSSKQQVSTDRAGSCHSPTHLYSPPPTHKLPSCCVGSAGRRSLPSAACLNTYPMTAASAHLSWLASALSTSAVPTLCPLTLMTSSTRPVIQ